MRIFCYIHGAALEGYMMVRKSFGEGLRVLHIERAKEEQKRQSQRPPAKKKRLEAPQPPLCVWCSAPWTDAMLKVSSEADYSTGDYGGIDSIETTIDITCSTCKRLVYRKHVVQGGNWGPGIVR